MDRQALNNKEALNSRPADDASSQDLPTLFYISTILLLLAGCCSSFLNSLSRRTNLEKLAAERTLTCNAYLCSSAAMVNRLGRLYLGRAVVAADAAVAAAAAAATAAPPSCQPSKALIIILNSL